MNQASQQSSIGMLCPACKVDLVMSDRQNIEIDYCPKCRGVWLDRGELDKIIEKSLGQSPDQAPARSSEPYRGHRERRDYDDDYRKQGYRRKSWLTEIFD